MKTINALNPAKENFILSQTSLDTFLQEWDKYYLNQISHVLLFSSKETAKWTLPQKQHFVKAFYHVRGHFHDFLWHLGNFAPHHKFKELIINNIRDELGGHKLSHEKLYRMFSEGLGVDLMQEHLEETTYLPFIRDFNKGHLRWLYRHDWETRIAGFAALERLDNVDYVAGKNIAESFGLKGKEVIFFNVHINVDHFENLLTGVLQDLWNEYPYKVKEGFMFIAEHQVTMWKNLSDEIFGYYA